MTVKTPILDFVRRYAKDDTLRLHMPGHKGVGALGIEGLDITEIEGADSLYEADGIIYESEQNASALFSSHTFYSTEGSSQCIRAMLLLSMQHAKEQGREPIVAFGRNAHRAALTACALLDIDPVWITPPTDNYLACPIDAQAVKALFEAENKPTAVYLTSPDYLGNTLPLGEIARVCHEHGALLLVDNAHGAYLKFLSPSRHPMDLGADACCDSAHKTLPVLTGGAYLHLSQNAPKSLINQAKTALATFGSTSPSYLTLASLDAANDYIANGYSQRLADFAALVEQSKQALCDHGYTLLGDEPLKISLHAARFGYTGREIADILLEKGIICEFSDREVLVAMLTPELGERALKRLTEALCALPRRAPLTDTPPAIPVHERVMSVREAMLSPCESVKIEQSVGRVLSAPTLACPPAVPIAIPGDRISEQTVKCMTYYGMKECCVVKE